MDNENINTNVNTDLQGQGSNTNNGNNEPEEKTFTQQQVDDIVEKRLNRERKKLMGMIQDDEETRKELERNRLELAMTKKLTAEKYPTELAELFDYSDEDTCKKSYEKIINIFNLALEKRVDEVFKRNGRTPAGANVSYGGRGDTSDLRAAFGLKAEE
ncbi:MAG: DUF4355 domain-containing protein [Clostridiales bacterium]|nr:DUF4355 domain-containing protein [Clostridiales bacterium]